MGMVTVNIWDATGAKRQEVQMPDDAPVNRILAVLLEKMKFPQHGPDGQLLSYKFHHKNSGKQLLDEQTLSAAGVKDGDVLRLQPEITAGRKPTTEAWRHGGHNAGWNRFHRRRTQRRAMDSSLPGSLL